MFNGLSYLSIVDFQESQSAMKPFFFWGGGPANFWDHLIISLPASRVPVCCVAHERSRRSVLTHY